MKTICVIFVAHFENCHWLLRTPPVRTPFGNAYSLDLYTPFCFQGPGKWKDAIPENGILAIPSQDLASYS